MFKVERSSPDRYRWERFRLRLLEFNLDLAVLIAETQIKNISGPPPDPARNDRFSKDKNSPDPPPRPPEGGAKIRNKNRPKHN